MRKLLFIIFIVNLMGCQQSINNQTVVALQPYNTFSELQMEMISHAINEVYGVSTVTLPSLKHSESSFINVKYSRYRADIILKEQKKTLNNSIDYILGLTHHDISTTKKENGKVKSPSEKYKDWGIMGLAYCPGRSGIVSSYRLKHTNKDVYFSRIKKVAVHELGHNFGLPHCPDVQCVMTDAVERVSTIDNAKLALCTSCALKIK